MPAKNLMQDIVVNILDEVLKKEGARRVSEHQKDEIIAYVLNRVPPRYVTSERGLLYGARCPVVLTSRADDNATKFNSLLLGIALWQKTAGQAGLQTGV